MVQKQQLIFLFENQTKEMWLILELGNSKDIKLRLKLMEENTPESKQLTKKETEKLKYI